MKDSIKKGIVVATPVMVFFAASCLRISSRSSGNAITNPWVGTLSVSLDKPSMKKGLIGGGIGLGFGLFMYFLIQYTAEARKQIKDNERLDSTNIKAPNLEFKLELADKQQVTKDIAEQQIKYQHDIMEGALGVVVQELIQEIAQEEVQRLARIAVLKRGQEIAQKKAHKAAQFLRVVPNSPALFSPISSEESDDEKDYYDCMATPYPTSSN